MGCSQSTSGGGGGGGPVKTRAPKWNSDEPMSGEDLERKREEFWDTAPYYGGNEECWGILKAAVEAGSMSETNSILVAAGMTCPSGVLTETYDALGYKYELPLYVLTKPANLSK